MSFMLGASSGRQSSDSGQTDAMTCRWLSGCKEELSVLMVLAKPDLHANAQADDGKPNS